MAYLIFLSAVLALVHQISGEHHMRWHVEKRQGSSRDTPMIVANWCSEDIYPALFTQGGDGPSENGFHLQPGTNQTVYVSSDWQGRVWGRTNCSFDDSGQAQGGSGSACTTGDCGGSLSCQIAGAPPATLAEFTLAGGMQQSYYDISMVDGYNLPVAIVLLANGNSQLEAMSGSKTNPSCVGSVGDLAPQNFNPYQNGQQFLGTSSSDPLSFNRIPTAQDVTDWCPWDLQVDAPLAPGDGIYPYPDGNVERPPFDPCLSACAKYNQDNYCCTGSYDGPSKCAPSYYSKAAKKICPDAYSYAYDDQDSTFIVPQGGGFQVIFCPGGRSTNILASSGGSTSGASSSGSNSQIRFGRLVVDGRVFTTALVALVVAMLVV